MFVTVHAAAAVIIGKKINISIVAFLLGLVSHFILDLIPHGDDQLGKRFLGIKIKSKEEFRIMALYGSIDSFFLAIFLIYLFKNFEFASANHVIWAIIGGILPDILVAIHKLTKFKPLNWFTKLHGKNHRLIVHRIKKDIPIRLGVAMQIIFMSVLIWLIYIL